MSVFNTVRGFGRCLTTIDGLILLVILLGSIKYMYEVKDLFELVIVCVIGIILLNIKGRTKK